ncbi:hypothetical protein BEL01nite_73520 [Bradyrhizobium elkanii]|nr:hypothetical protein BEL01nite_73520 [Bradyrhizobium elkanii]
MHSKAISRSWNLQLRKKDIAHIPVEMLTGVNDIMVHVSFCGKSVRNDCSLYKLWARAHY